MLWIEDIVESTPTPPFWTNFTAGMVGFVDPHKVVARNALLAFPSTQNGVELEGGTKSEKLKHQFSQAEGDLDLQEISNPVPIPNKRKPRKEMLGIKDEDEESKKLERRSIAGSRNKKGGGKKKRKKS